MNQLACFPSWVVASLLALAVPVEGIFGSLTRSKGFEEPLPLPEYRLSLRYQQCIDDLKASDTDGDLKVSSDEFVGFISTRSKGAIDVGGYPDLPFSLISNYVYGACYCSVFTGESGCCVGANAGISLDIEQYPEIEVNLVTLCRNINAAIGIETATPSPTMSPEPPSAKPVEPATPAPSPSPTVAPIAPTPVPTASPTPEPTAAPVDPTPSPTVTSSDVPTTAPVDATPSPTADPTANPTTDPTASPTVSPTASPTAKPTVKPTASPTAKPTAEPTPAPTEKPTLAPVPATSNPTETPPDLVCLMFQYGVESADGFSAEDIELGTNNTIKSDLIDATRDIVISVLNSTSVEGKNLRTNKPSGWKPSKDKDLLGVIQIHGSGYEHRRRTAFVATETTIHDRRLEFYSDAFPPTITDVFDNPFCAAASDGITKCSIIDTTVCVVLEEGEDPAQVRARLVGGISGAFRDGRFENLLQ